MATAKDLKVTFTYDRDTRNKVRFKEDGSGNMVGALYLQKEAHEKIGKPTKVTVTISTG